MLFARPSHFFPVGGRPPVVLALVVVVVVGGGVLVLHHLADEVVHVGLGLGELHGVHPLARVPVQEGLAPEHGRELRAHAHEEVLDARVVAHEGGGHLQAPRRDVAHRSLEEEEESYQ